MPLHPRDKAPFGEMLGAVASIYGRDVSPAFIALYWQALAAYDLAAIRQAFDRHVKNPDHGQFMPKPADLIRMLSGSTLDAAMAAWAKVERAIRSVGGHSDVVFDDPLVHRCIADMGGWSKLCEVLEADLPFRAREFQTLYRGFSGRREIPPYPGILVGRFSTHNRAQGLPCQPPMLIGNSEQCGQVWRAGMENGAHVRIGEASESATPSRARAFAIAAT